jgi:hypothetical protein
VFGVARMNAGAASLTSRGRGFYWGDDTAGLKRVIARLAAAHVRHPPEPAVQARPDLMELWRAATGGELPKGDAYDVTRTGDGQAVQGTGGVRDKIAAARDLLAGNAPPAASVAPAAAAAAAGDVRGKLAAAAALLARSGPARPSGGTPAPSAPSDGTPGDIGKLRALLAARGLAGVSVRQAARYLDVTRDRAHKLLTELTRQDFATVADADRGTKARFVARVHLAGSPGPAGYPVPGAPAPAAGTPGARLAVVPVLPDDDDDDAEDLDDDGTDAAEDLDDAGDPDAGAWQ